MSPEELRKAFLSAFGDEKLAQQVMTKRYEQQLKEGMKPDG